MDSARRVRFYIRLVDATSVPLAVVMLLYLLSGYGMISRALQQFGFTYAFWARIHTSPILRIAAVALTVLHGYPGLVVLAFKRVKSHKARLAIELALLALTLAFCALIVYAELSAAGFTGFGRGRPRP
ncbi:MAG: hypothetical protein QXP94_03455 [Thermofilaceae archaeon]